MVKTSALGDIPLTVAQGGTGAVTLTGSLVGNGTGAITAITSVPSIVSNVTGTSQAMAVSTAYVSNHASATVAFTLPSTAALGDVMQVIGNGPGGWTIAQNASQAIKGGSQTTTTGTSGQLASTAHYDSVTLQCAVSGASTIWNIVNFSGTLTFV